MGVDAVELDVGHTADGVVVLNHDQTLSAVTCTDTGPATPGDPLYPYVGRRICDLTLAQIKTVEAGVRRPVTGDKFQRTQLSLPGTRLPTLAEVCALVGQYQAGPRLAIELKTDPGWPRADVERFVAAVAQVVTDHGLTGRARLLGFDWRVLSAARRLDPELGRVALVEEPTLRPGSQWLDGHDGADWLGSAAAAGAMVVSPEYPLVTPEVVLRAHSLGLPLALWTVNDPADMARFIEYGVDAIVTDYPDRLRAVMESHGLELPRPAQARQADRVG